jgi:hypothetical protein
MPEPDARTRVTVSTQLWSDEVAIANAGCPLPEKEIAYEFSDGHRFEEGLGPYAP